MARVTAADVKAILDDTTLKESTINVFITSAHTMVDEVLGTGETDVLKEIERWLTAHMIVVTRERQAIREEAGTVRIDYSGVFGAGLNSTTYGQMVLALDTTKAMSSLAGTGKSASVFVIPSFE